MKINDFSRIFQDFFQQIQGPISDLWQIKLYVIKYFFLFFKIFKIKWHFKSNFLVVPRKSNWKIFQDFEGPLDP